MPGWIEDTEDWCDDHRRDENIQEIGEWPAIYASGVENLLNYTGEGEVYRPGVITVEKIET